MEETLQKMVAHAQQFALSLFHKFSFYKDDEPWYVTEMEACEDEFQGLEVSISPHEDQAC
jgi:hypothetical protein